MANHLITEHPITKHPITGVPVPTTYYKSHLTKRPITKHPIHQNVPSLNVSVTKVPSIKSHKEKKGPSRPPPQKKKIISSIEQTSQNRYGTGI